MKKVLQRALSFGVLLSMSLVFTSTGFAQEVSDAALQRCRDEVDSEDIEKAKNEFAELDLAPEKLLRQNPGLSLIDENGPSYSYLGSIGHSLSQGLGQAADYLGENSSLHLQVRGNDGPEVALHLDVARIDVAGTEVICSTYASHSIWPDINDSETGAGMAARVTRGSWGAGLAHDFATGETSAMLTYNISLTN